MRKEVKLRKEFKYGIGGLVFGFVFCLGLFFLVVTASAAEKPVTPKPLAVSALNTVIFLAQDSESQEDEIVQDTQEITEEPPRWETPTGENVVQDEQIDLAEMIPADQLEILDGLAQDLAASEDEARIEPFASGVIVGELADLLQDNVIENDGYTEESWQRYEEATAAGWAVISNFMAYTNDEVRAVIDEMQAAISGLEYPAGKLPDFGGGSSADNGIVAGLLAVLVFSSGLRVAA